MQQRHLVDHIQPLFNGHVQGVHHQKNAIEPDTDHLSRESNGDDLIPDPTVDLPRFHIFWKQID